LRTKEQYEEALKVLEKVQHHPVQEKFVLYNAVSLLITYFDRL